MPGDVRCPARETASASALRDVRRDEGGDGRTRKPGAGRAHRSRKSTRRQTSSAVSNSSSMAVVSPMTLKNFAPANGSLQGRGRRKRRLSKRRKTRTAARGLSRRPATPCILWRKQGLTTAFPILRGMPPMARRSGYCSPRCFRRKGLRFTPASMTMPAAG